MSHESGHHPAAEPLSDAERRQLVSAERDARAAAETALAALAKTEAKFRSIVETTTEWMWACDVEGRLTYSNAAVASILGYRAVELLGHDSFELIHADDQEDVLAIFRECIEKQTGRVSSSVGFTRMARTATSKATEFPMSVRRETSRASAARTAT